MKRTIRGYSQIAAMALSLAPGHAWAQRAAENAVLAADDAFGTTVGLEVTGIYSENDTRGFSPLKAGNYRLDGIYFDPVATVSGRTKTGAAIRVGHAANDFPFPAPTGIVDAKLRSAGDDFTASLALTRSQFGGDIEELDFRVPVVRDRLSLALGVGHSYSMPSDRTPTRSWSGLFKPVLRWNGGEFSPFFAISRIYDNNPRPLIQVPDGVLPPLPDHLRYLGQTWARGLSTSINTGATLRTTLGGGFSLRAGLFRSSSVRDRNYSEIFAVTAPSGLSRHRFIADPKQDLHSWSGEAQIAWRLGDARVQHRLIAGYRARDRHTETGGSDVRDFGTVTLGELDAEVMPAFTFGAVNVGRVRQSAVMLGYMGTLAGVGQINLGLQRATYRADFLDARSGATTHSRSQAWLYNASAVIELSKALALFAGTQRGLEDSGTAPENAANRNEQLPATRSTQYEGGLRWKQGQSQLKLSMFQIEKPYFSFDATGRFTELGTVRHRGVEASFHGTYFKRLSVLAGAVAMQPRVSGPARDLGLVGPRPAGTPSLYARLDLNYRTDLLGGLTPTASFIWQGNRAVGSRPVVALGGAQQTLPGYGLLDLGLRQQFHIGKIPASFRYVLNNVLDHKAWKVLASNVLQPDDRRRFSLTVAADF
ncbi:MAG: TonB-dependent receptor [Sphingomonadales bacterium]|nr:TonB-dependent receptor [Sphingomonadales bacterium]